MIYTQCTENFIIFSVELLWKNAPVLDVPRQKNGSNFNISQELKKKKNELTIACDYITYVA